MSTHQLIVNEDFSEQPFRESYIHGKYQQDFIQILFEYPSIELNNAALQLANTLSLFSEIVHFSLSINPYCFLSKDSYEQIALGITKHMNKIEKLCLQIGDYCSLTDLSFFSILKNLSCNLKEFSFELGEQNILDDEQVQHLSGFISNQPTLNTLKIKISGRNYFTNKGFTLISQSLQTLENLIELSFYLDMNRINESSVFQFTQSLTKLKCLKIFKFIDQSLSVFFPGILYILEAVVSLVDLNSLEIIFSTDKFLNRNETEQLFEGVNNLKYLQKLVLKGFNLSQVDFGRVDCFFLHQKNTLEVLELDFDQISSKNELISFLGKGLQLLTGLKEFNLNISKHSFIQEAGCIQISEYISKMISLAKLNLKIQQGNRIGKEGLYSLGKAFTNLNYLSHLDLLIDDQNDQDMIGLKYLLDGVKCLVKLIDFRFKLICKESKGSSMVCQFLGETFSCLALLKKVDIDIETNYIELNDYKGLCSGLSTLKDLRELRVNILENKLSLQENFIFQAVQNSKELKVLRVSCNQNEWYNTQGYQSPVIFGGFDNIIELHMRFILVNFSDQNLIKQGFQNMKQLKVLSLKLIIAHGHSQSQLIKDFCLPSSVENFKFELKTFYYYSQLKVQFLEMFKNLKNLKVLSLSFSILNLKYDILEILKICQNLVSLSLKLNYFILPDEIENISQAISSLINLRELTLDIPTFYDQVQPQTQSFKDAIGSLKKLYRYNEYVKFLEQPQTEKYDHLVHLPNLVRFNHNEYNYSDTREVKQTKKYRRRELNEIHFPAKFEENISLTSRNLTQLALSFFNKMTPLCYIKILQNLQYFQKLKELTFNFGSRVYLSKYEISHIRIGLSQLVNLTSLSIKCNQQEKDYILNKKIVYALGVSLQNISQVENLTLEIAKESNRSYSDYFAKLAQGIKNQKKLLHLELKMNGLNWLEWQSFNLKDMLQNTGDLRALRLSFSEIINENNLIQLGESLIYQNQLRTLSIALSSKNSISAEAVLSINQGIKSCNLLQSVTLESNTGDDNCLINLMDSKNSDNYFLEEFNLRFIVEDKISTEVLEKDMLSIERLKHLKKLKYEILFSFNSKLSKETDSIERFFKNFFNNVQLPSCTRIECTVPNEDAKRIETNLNIMTKDQLNFQFIFQFDSDLVDRCLNLLKSFPEQKEITKLECFFPKYSIYQSISFQMNSHHLFNLLKLNLLINNVSESKNTYDNFAIGIRQMVSLRSLSLYLGYQKIFDVSSFNLVITSLKELKQFSSLRIYHDTSNLDHRLTQDYKSKFLEMQFRFSELSNLKFIQVGTFNSQLIKHFKRKITKMVNIKLNQTHLYGFSSLKEQFDKDDF